MIRLTECGHERTAVVAILETPGTYAVMITSVPGSSDPARVEVHQDVEDAISALGEEIERLQWHHYSSADILVQISRIEECDESWSVGEHDPIPAEWVIVELPYGGAVLIADGAGGGAEVGMYESVEAAARAMNEQKRRLQEEWERMKRSVQEEWEEVS